jgi:hypothetical protein
VPPSRTPLSNRANLRKRTSTAIHIHCATPGADSEPRRG